MRNIKNKFTVSESAEFEGIYDPSENWNGWACPYFNEETAHKIANWFNEHPKEGLFIVWSGDTMIMTEEEFPEESTIVEPTEIEYDGEIINVWQIGGYEWCWEVAE